MLLYDFENLILGFSTIINLEVVCDVKKYIMTERLRANLFNALPKFI